MKFNEETFYNFIDKLRDEGKITPEEYDACANYVCGLNDALSIYGVYEEE